MSLPVPVSPVINTDMSSEAASRILLKDLLHGQADSQHTLELQRNWHLTGGSRSRSWRLADASLGDKRADLIFIHRSRESAMGVGFEAIQAERVRLSGPSQR